MDFRDKLILAPMAGVCDQPFRLLCKEQGCDILYSEMVSAKAIYYKNKNTKPLLAMDEREKPFGLQLFGSDPEIMAEMAKRIESNGYSFIDVNMGCPVPKVVNNGEGSALMKDPVLVGRIVEAMAKAISIPLTIKIRSGFDSEHINAPEIAHIAQESGAAAARKDKAAVLSGTCGLERHSQGEGGVHHPNHWQWRYKHSSGHHRHEGADEL